MTIYPLSFHIVVQEIINNLTEQNKRLCVGEGASEGKNTIVCLEGKGQNFLINQYRRYSKFKYTPELRFKNKRKQALYCNYRYLYNSGKFCS